MGIERHTLIMTLLQRHNARVGERSRIVESNRAAGCWASGADDGCAEE
jgi:hypothetical protein